MKIDIKEKIIREAKEKGSLCFLEGCDCGGLEWLTKILNDVENATIKEISEKEVACELRGFELGKKERENQIYNDLMKIANERDCEELKKELIKRYFEK